MEIKVDSLKTEVNKFNRMIEEYEEIYLNLYNQISSASFYWQDPKAIQFFKQISLEKLQVKTMIDEMNSVRQVYAFLIEKYQMLGNKIVCNLQNRDRLLLKFDRYVNQLNNLIDHYNRLNLSFCRKEARYLRNQRSILISMRNEIMEIRDCVKQKFNDIETIEKEVNLKISRLKIEIIKETDIQQFI